MKKSSTRVVTKSAQWPSPPVVHPSQLAPPAQCMLATLSLSCCHGAVVSMAIPVNGALFWIGKQWRCGSQQKNDPYSDVFVDSVPFMIMVHDVAFEHAP